MTQLQPHQITAELTAYFKCSNPPLSCLAQGAAGTAGVHLPAAERQQGDVRGRVRGRVRGAAPTLLHLTFLLDAFRLVAPGPIRIVRYFERLCSPHPHT